MTSPGHSSGSRHRAAEARCQTRSEPLAEAELTNRPPESLDLAAGGSHRLQSTGYRQDFSWIRAPGVLAENGAPYQRQGVSPVPGIHFVGLHRMWEAGSGTLLGCGWAATNVAEHILRSG